MFKYVQNQKANDHWLFHFSCWTLLCFFSIRREGPPLLSWLQWPCLARDNRPDKQITNYMRDHLADRHSKFWILQVIDQTKYTSPTTNKSCSIRIHHHAHMAVVDVNGSKNQEEGVFFNFKVKTRVVMQYFLKLKKNQMLRFRIWLFLWRVAHFDFKRRLFLICTKFLRELAINGLRQDPSTAI